MLLRRDPLRLAVSSQAPEEILGAAIHQATVGTLGGASKVARWSRYVRQVRANRGRSINRHWGKLPAGVWRTADAITQVVRQGLVG